MLRARIAKYIESTCFNELPDHSLSEYWKFHHAQVKVSTKGAEFSARGDSGFYAPSRSRSVFAKIGSLLSNPCDYSRIVYRQLMLRAIRRSFLALQLAELDGEVAFDAVMNHHPVSDIDISPWRIDFRKVAQTPGCISTAAGVKADYLSSSGGIPPNGHIYRAYYVDNIFRYIGAYGSNFSFLEIGAGNGNLSCLLLRRATATSYIVDLPATICGAVDYLTKMMPDLRFLLPNEAAESPLSRDDIQLVFLTPAQIHLIPDGAVQMAVNTASFQEMVTKQVAEYFDLVDRVVHPGGLFASLNRVEKIPGGSNMLSEESQAVVMRSSEFPWRAGREVLVNEICRFHRLTQRDNCTFHIERLGSR